MTSLTLTGSARAERGGGDAGSTGRSAPVVTVGVLALQGAVREHVAMLGRLGVAATEVRRPGDLAAVDGLIIPGGESTAISMLIDSAGLRAPLQDRLDRGMPAFGTCAGMILLATDVADGRPDQHVFSAIDIGVRRNAFGRQVDSFETDLSVEGLDGGRVPLHAVFIRAPFVERVGPGVEVLANVDASPGSSGDEARPVVCRQGRVLVTAFHPELTADTRLHQLFVSVVADAVEAGGSGRDGDGAAGPGQDEMVRGATEAAAGESRQAGASTRKEG